VWLARGSGMSSIRSRIPFAVILPDGEWRQKGEMGWWGFYQEEKHGIEWEGIVRGYLEAHQKALVVSCDVHI